MEIKTLSDDHTKWWASLTLTPRKNMLRLVYNFEHVQYQKKKTFWSIFIFIVFRDSRIKGFNSDSNFMKKFLRF